MGFVPIRFISMVTGYIILGQKNAIKNEIDIKLWIIGNQFSRRNLPTETRLALAYRFKELEAENAETEVSQLTDSLPVGSREDTTKGKTLEIIAQKAGVSRATAEQYDAIQRKGTDEQKAKVVEGNKVIKRFLDSIKKLEFNRDTERKYPSLKLCTYVRSWEVLSIYKKAGF